MQLSDQQKAVVQAVAANNSNIQVTARAGCGKTTTILAACAQAQGRVAFFAFNKAIATELQRKAPPHVQVQTLHSLGFRVLKQTYGRVDLDADKTYNLIRNKLKDTEWDLMGPAKKLVGLIKNYLSDMSDDSLNDICAEHQIDFDTDDEDEREEKMTRLFQVARTVIIDGLPPARAASIVIDFDDMIFLPPYLKLANHPTFDWTFVDEAQDVNKAQMELIKMVSRNGKVCYVGDPAQAIYAFRGADSQAMYTLQNYFRSVGKPIIELPLTQTRRCPRLIVEQARQYVPDFEALPEAPEGVVREADLDPSPGDMVVCRLNAPLVGPAYRLLRSGVPVKIQGRDLGAGLVVLIKRLHASSIDDLLERLGRHQDAEERQLSIKWKDKPTKLAIAITALVDKCDTIRELASGQTSVLGLLDSIERLFADISSVNGVVLMSTIHKAKGLEADRVWFIETPTGPGGQENNLRYVAITRAKHELVFVPHNG